VHIVPASAPALVPALARARSSRWAPRRRDGADPTLASGQVAGGSRGASLPTRGGCEGASGREENQRRLGPL